jgi:hypothetical protein
MKLTKVVFRKFPDNEVIALFPQLAGTKDPHSCQSYCHIGQHSPASAHLARATKLATPKEYKTLARELRGLGYKLRIATRFTRFDLEQRKREIGR